MMNYEIISKRKNTTLALIQSRGTDSLLKLLVLGAWHWCFQWGTSQWPLAINYFYSLWEKSTTMTTNKSTIPAEEQISHNSGRCLNWVHKGSREACWDTGTVCLCLKEPCSFEFVLCLCPCEASRKVHKLTSKSNCHLFAAPTQATLNNKNSTARGKERQTRCVTLTLI